MIPFRAHLYAFSKIPPVRESAKRILLHNFFVHLVPNKRKYIKGG